MRSLQAKTFIQIAEKLLAGSKEELAAFRLLQLPNKDDTFADDIKAMKEPKGLVQMQRTPTDEEMKVIRSCYHTESATVDLGRMQKYSTVHSGFSSCSFVNLIHSC